ncbi:hypothetical protein CZ787_13255 [Halomonas citrativorans]|uniref:Uncharacterized protein n=1 Tax=Halomonas citrativorans TaxID=2742612 RepID=A0A1R4I2H1_9GAMM|nr:hypothetical protein CZ787_13255 [Halomonas citrativorans]
MAVTGFSFRSNAKAVLAPQDEFRFNTATYTNLTQVWTPSRWRR